MYRLIPYWWRTLPRRGHCLWLVEAHFPRDTTNQKPYPDLGSDTSLHFPDVGIACDWLKHIFLAIRPIRSLTQIWVVIRHRYGISPLVPQTSFRGENSYGLAKCRQFSQAVKYHKCSFNNFHCYHNWKLRALFFRTRSRDLKIIKWLPRRI